MSVGRNETYKMVLGIPLSSEYLYLNLRIDRNQNQEIKFTINDTGEQKYFFTDPRKKIN